MWTRNLTAGLIVMLLSQAQAADPSLHYRAYNDVGVSVLACNAARALADMHEKAGDAAKCREWQTIANAMRTIRMTAFAGWQPPFPAHRPQRRTSP